ncbi:hypothetical protein EDC01DRAFT_380064 [Geopyxis carbonaria]|nr:hypothetical protein EDC01DRAFT_380064 [Geopyxis carbonaria]
MELFKAQGQQSKNYLFEGSVMDGVGEIENIDVETFALRHSPGSIGCPALNRWSPFLDHREVDVVIPLDPSPEESTEIPEQTNRIVNGLNTCGHCGISVGAEGSKMVRSHIEGCLNRFFCLNTNCTRALERPFTRVDNLIQHLRSAHDWIIPKTRGVGGHKRYQ